MAIKIEKISVKNLGPIRDFSTGLGLFNLIFSKNECGKTFLTEFIIRSLFKNTKRWQFRDNGTGIITVSGLKGSSGGAPGLTEFSPGTAKKLEDYWEKEETGLPLSMVKLLVSKGGEAAIEDTGEGIGKGLIKEIFSGISLLDKIDNENNISRTVKSAQFEDGNINIAAAGEGKAYRQLKSETDKINGLFSEIESQYKMGLLQSFKSEQEQLKEHAEKLYKAKCYEAFTISEKINRLNGGLQQNNEEELSSIMRDISLYESRISEYDGKASQIEEFNERCQNYEWLQKAQPLYEKFSTAAVRRPHIIFAVLSGIFVLAAILFSIFNIAAGTIVALAISVGLIAFYIIRAAGLSKSAGLQNELGNLKKEFKNRTGIELTNIATLNLESDRQKEFYDKSRLLKDQLEDLKTKIRELKSAIGQSFYNLSQKQVPEPQWHSTISAKRQEDNSTRNEIEALRLKLSDLAVREIEYLAEDPGIKFSYDESEKAESALGDIGSRIGEIESNISSLKYRVCIETDDDQSIGWDQLMENLRKKRLEKQKELELCEALIIAGIIVHSEVTALRLEEDRKITEGLQSDVVIAPLMEVTGKYKRLFMDGERLMVSDDYRNFCMTDLSTGAREQVMLALRIGFASKVLKQDTLFLILDDAFQHSDWDKRKILVNKLADIAAGGWQIIYFSMDNHIRDLFDSAGSKFKKGEYKCIELA
jgi:uncharacterized protein YhaN